MKEQFRNLQELITHFANEKKCRDYLAYKRWKGKPTCPYYRHDKVYVIEGGKRYKCASNKCYKKFSVTVGTIYEDNNLPLGKWFAAIYLMSAHKKGISSHQLARDIGVTQRTAWFLQMRIREMVKDKNPQALTGTVQCDETFIGGKHKNRHWDKKSKYWKYGGRDQRDKVPVFGMLQQNGKVVAVVVKSTDRETLLPIIKERIDMTATIVTDDYKSYASLKADYKHKIVKYLPPKGERHQGLKYFNIDGYNTQGIENFWSVFKRGIFGIYHKVSAKHLQRYCDEFTARRNTRALMDHERFNLFMESSEGRLKYKDLRVNEVYYPYFDQPFYE